jgi:transposase
MADACMPEKFYESARPMLPEEQEIGPQGGRPPKTHRVVLKVIWFVLVTGCRWKDVPQEMGCCGETARTRLQAWERAGIWDRLHQLLLTMLNHEHQLHLKTAIIDTTQVRAFGGGDATGPSPVDRRKKGTKYTLLVDRGGVPLVIRAVPANRSDHLEILQAVVSFPTVGGKPGRPRTHPEKLYGDAGFDCEATRSILRWLGIEPHIRHRNGDHGSHLGRVRWVVERTISWIKGLRRMRVRYDRSGTSIDAWTSLAAAVVCLHILSEAVAA